MDSLTLLADNVLLFSAAMLSGVIALAELFSDLKD
jgi:hypothetical protein